MKHIFFIIAMVLSSVGAMAQTCYLRDALVNFVTQSNVKSSFTESNGQDPAPWQVKQYDFTVASKTWNSQLKGLVNAFHKDSNHAEYTHIAEGPLRQKGNAMKFIVRTAPSEPAVTIGTDSTYSIIVVRMLDTDATAQGRRLVCAMEWRPSPGKRSTIEGKIHIVNGVSRISQGTIKKEKQEAEKGFNVTERQRRMLFFQERATQTEVNDAIASGAVLAAMDIAENGTIEDIETAQKALDVLISQVKLSKTWSKEYLARSREGNMIEKFTQAQTKLLEASKRQNAKQYTSSEEAKVEALLKNARQYTNGNFILTGRKDKELGDVGYYIYKANDDFTFPTDIHDDVRVEDNKFRYACYLTDITWGKVNAIMHDGTICTAWIEIPFVPGEEAVLNVHDNYYSLTGTTFYQEWTKASRHGPVSVEEIMKHHLNNYGYLCYAFKRNYLSSTEKQEVWNALHRQVQENYIGRFLKKCM